MSDKSKKVRSANFSKEEELLLGDEVYKEKAIIENKVSNKISQVEKEQAWGRVEKGFNSKNYLCRNLEQLKSKFDNLKTKARKVVASEKICVRGTGGGPGFDRFDPIIESVLKIINIKTVVGLENTFDCDQYDEETASNSMRSSQHYTVDPFPICVLNDTSSGNEPLPSCSSFVSDNITVEETMPDIQQSTPTPNFQKQLSPKPVQSDGNEKNSTPRSTSKRSLGEGWSHYVPRKLKEPVSKKLRPTIATPLCQAKEEYYRLKCEYLKGDLQHQKKREEREVKEEKRREEEHRRKMLLLDLEIQKMQNNVEKK